jgi:hypothetical protein
MLCPGADRDTIKRVRKDAKVGKSALTQAGEFVREEIEHIREGKHGARSAKQAIAIGLSKARRAGVKLAPPDPAKTSRQRSGKPRKIRRLRASRISRPSDGLEQRLRHFNARARRPLRPRRCRSRPVRQPRGAPKRIDRRRRRKPGRRVSEPNNGTRQAALEGPRPRSSGAELYGRSGPT